MEQEDAKMHEAQLLNYLKASRKKIGLLVNFAHPKAQIRRFVLLNFPCLPCASVANGL